MVPDKPIPDDDPIVSKSLAPHYVVAVIVLMATLFWALWDEDFGQRPWKTFQNEWKTRYTTFLKNARSQSGASQKEVESCADYQALNQPYEQATPSAKILAVRNVFTARRAYVTASSYDIETEASSSAKQRKQRNLDEYKKEIATVEYPDGSKQRYTFPQLEDVYNDLKNERTRLSAELGELIKPVNEKKEKLDAYVSEHMINLTPSQITGLQDKTEAWDAKIQQINVPDANIVDRCESCHMGVRE